MRNKLRKESCQEHINACSRLKPKIAKSNKNIANIVSANLYCQPLYLIDFTSHLSSQGKNTNRSTASTKNNAPKAAFGTAFKIA